MRIIMVWTLAATAYISYAVLALKSSDTATKVWVALLFVIVSVWTWHYLRTHHDTRKRK